MKYDAAVVKCDCYEPTVIREAMKELLIDTGALDWVNPGMKIGIKANLLSALPPERAATTHFELLTALTEMLIERKASVVISDSPGGLYNSIHLNKVYNITGLRKAEAAGAELSINCAQTSAEFKDGRVLRQITYTSWLDNVDAIINFSKLKAHAMMGLTASVKNMFGVIPGVMKPEYHYKYTDYNDFANMLIDINEFFRDKVKLCIVDGIIGMEGNGPSAGTPIKIGFLAASDSPYKLDMLCAHALKADMDMVPTLKTSHKRGFIPDAYDKMNVSGFSNDMIVNNFSFVSQKSDLLFKDTNVILKYTSNCLRLLMRAKPKLDEKKCIGCGVCMKMCPAKAISIKNEKPEIDRAKCILCFCCQEFCPKGAMHVNRTILAKIAGRL